MDFKEYQKLAMRTKNKQLIKDQQLLNAALGLNGEAGELADEIKKIFFHGHELNKDKLIKEAGDILWYIALLADAIGVDMETIAEKNIEKLKKRYPEGFSSERSIHRQD